MTHKSDDSSKVEHSSANVDFFLPKYDNVGSFYLFISGLGAFLKQKNMKLTCDENQCFFELRGRC